ncbi:MAG: hypothetical protein JW839_01985 [Candidatus Lokiarchaeota archaeon]|nr:hypothetical protein [Candidatus Lokiarchaeota archaeon]
MASLDFALGIACVLTGTAINSAGLLLQKREVNRSGMVDGSDIAPFLRRPFWILGILMQTLIFAPFFFIGIDLVGITLAQPLANAGLLVFVAGAVLALKERLSRIEWAGVSLVIAALFLVSLAGVSGDVSVSALIQGDALLRATAFSAAIAGLAVLGWLLARLPRPWSVQGPAVLVGTSYAVVSISGQLVTVGFGAASNPGSEAMGWLLGAVGLAGVVLGTLFGIIFSQRAFKRAPAIHVIPASQSITNVLPIVAGIYLFGQGIAFVWLFVPGIAMLLVAVILLARFQR